MESITTGFIAQFKGKPTKRLYHNATIFLDHHIYLTYIHLQIGFSSDEMVQAKKLFGDYTRTYKVRIRHYHAGNIQFSNNAFLQAVAQEKTHQIFQSECSLPKWKVRKRHQISPIAHNKTASPRQCMVAERRRNGNMALRTKKSYLPYQLPT